MKDNEREGFVFYRSFWDAVNQLPAKDQLPILKAIILFGLDGLEPDKLTPHQNAFYLLVRPILLKGRNKAANGKQGGSKKKANVSKRKQNESDGECASRLLLSDERQGSNPYGLQIEMNDEGGDVASPPNDGSLFTAFWYAYPETAKRRREDAWNAWRKLNPTPEEAAQIMACLEAWKRSKRWMDDNGEYIPNAENFLDPARGYLCSSPTPAKRAVPMGASGELGAAEMEAIQKVLREE